MSTAPRISDDVKVSPKKRQPAMSPKTISRLQIREASVGGTPFCPRIWKVKAIPVEKMAQYKTGSKAFRKMETVNDSPAGYMAKKLKRPQKKNCPMANFTPS